jgi:hypothetical protein
VLTLSQLQNLFEKGHIDLFALVAVHCVHFTSRLVVVSEFEHGIEIWVPQTNEVMALIVLR